MMKSLASQWLLINRCFASVMSVGLLVLILTLMVPCLASGEDNVVVDELRRQIVDWAESQPVPTRKILWAGDVIIVDGNSRKIFNSEEQGFINGLISKMASEAISNSRARGTAEKFKTVDDAANAEIMIKKVILRRADRADSVIRGELFMSYRNSFSSEMVDLPEAITFEIDPTLTENVVISPIEIAQVATEKPFPDEVFVTSPSDVDTEDTTPLNFDVALILRDENGVKQEHPLVRSPDDSSLYFAHNFPLQREFEIRLKNPFAFDAAAAIRINGVPRNQRDGVELLDHIAPATPTQIATRDIVGMRDATTNDKSFRFILQRNTNEQAPTSTDGHLITVVYHFASDDASKLRQFTADRIDHERGLTIGRGSAVIENTVQKKMFVSDPLRSIKIVFVEQSVVEP